MTTLHIIITAFVALALWWLLKDYPTWRQNQLQMTKQRNETNVNVDQQKSSSPSTQQQQESTHVDNSNGNGIIDLNTEKTPTTEQQVTPRQPSNDDTVTSPTQDQPSNAPTLNLVQYTLMIPMAVVYLIGRTAVDVTRGCLFRLLYMAEQAAPAIDSWLFDKVTVWIPKKYDQVETWWTTKGRHIYDECQHTFIYHTIPATIDYIDAFFLHVYNGGQLVMEAIHKVGDSLRLFREKHDWRQLFLDMGNIGYTLFWQPFASVMTHIYRLGTLFCQGFWYGLKATWNDIRWTATVGLPMVLNWVKTRREWVWTKRAWCWCRTLVENVALKVVMTLSPVLSWFGRWMVHIGDALGTLIQSSWVQSVWRHVRYAFINTGVWLGGEVVVLVHSVKKTVTAMVDNGLVPLIQLFMNHVMPRLSDSYQRFLVKACFAYQRYVQPVGKQCIVWCNGALRPLIHILERRYLALLSFLSRWRWDGVIRVSAVITQSLQWMMGWIMGSLGPAINNMATTLVNHHLPIAVECVHYGWKKVMDNLDTSAMISAIEQLYQVIQEQCSLVFASLERTMNEWKEAQQEPDMRSDSGKGTKIS